jgi:tripartite-type tricarboxylate transporter receptor subunit TctC
MGFENSSFAKVCLSRRSVLVAGAAAAVTRVVPAWSADKYPSRNITIVVPFGPGAITDLIARLFGGHLSKKTGTPVVVENKPGAGCIVGSAVVARAAPDGYTLIATTSTSHSVPQALFKTVPYNPIEDFTHISRIGNFPGTLCVRSDLPAKTIVEFVEYAKANPGKVQYGHGNSSGQITCEALKAKTGIEMVRIVYRATPQVVNDVLGGQIVLAAIDLSTALPFIKAGSLRPLAVSTDKRSPILPDIPTLSETVVPGYNLLPWFGYAGPRGLPQNIVDLIGAESHDFISRPDIQKKLADMGVDIAWTSPADMGAFVRSEQDIFMRQAAAAGITPE